MISKVPVKHVEERITHCDGGGGALGHPKVYINLVRNLTQDKPGPQACGTTND
jgi:NADH dehydrogenase (ubiquinone) Fe-S protein 6